MDKSQIQKMLIEFRENKNVIEQLKELFDLDSILNVAFKEKMYDVILELFKPITINNKTKIYFDIFTHLSKHYDFFEKFEVSEERKVEIAKSLYSIDLEKIKQIKIGDSLPRTISGWGYPIKSVNDVIYYAEPACLEAMVYLYNINIRTIQNDTECVDGEQKENGICNIWIDYNSLSEENKIIANEFITAGVANYVENAEQKTVEIKVPCNRNETVGIVSERLLNLVKKFNKQVFLYGRFTVEQMKEKIKNGISNDDFFPDYSWTYQDYMFELIENGKIKEKVNGEIEIEDGRRFLLDDVINKIINSEIWLSAIYNTGKYYYDDKEQTFWESKEYYKKYIESLQMNSEFSPILQGNETKIIKR